MSGRRWQPGEKFELNQTLRLKLVAVLGAPGGAVFQCARFQIGFRIPLAQRVPGFIIRRNSAMSDKEQNPEQRIALFQRQEIRRAIHNNEWWFVITDVVAALTDSANPQCYFKDMRKRDPQLAEALKGGGKLPPPLASSSTRRADARCSNAGTDR